MKKALLSFLLLSNFYQTAKPADPVTAMVTCKTVMWALPPISAAAIALSAWIAPKMGVDPIQDAKDALAYLSGENKAVEDYRTLLNCFWSAKRQPAPNGDGQVVICNGKQMTLDELADGISTVNCKGTVTLEYPDGTRVTEESAVYGCHQPKGAIVGCDGTLTTLDVFEDGAYQLECKGTAIQIPVLEEQLRRFPEEAKPALRDKLVWYCKGDLSVGAGDKRQLWKSGESTYLVTPYLLAIPSEESGVTEIHFSKK